MATTAVFMRSLLIHRVAQDWKSFLRFAQPTTIPISAQTIFPPCVLFIIIVSVDLFSLQDHDDKTTQYSFAVYSDVETPSIFIALARIVHCNVDSRAIFESLNAH